MVRREANVVRRVVVLRGDLEDEGQREELVDDRYYGPPVGDRERAVLSGDSASVHRATGVQEVVYGWAEVLLDIDNEQRRSVHRLSHGGKEIRRRSIVGRKSKVRRPLTRIAHDSFSP